MPLGRGTKFAISFAVSAAIGTSLLIGTVEPTTLRPVIDAQHSGLRWMSSRELAARMARRSSEKPILLDVRTEAEFAVSHLEGARRIDPDNPDLSSLDLSPKSTVVVYCSVGYRSAAIVERLKRSGVTRVYNLDWRHLSMGERGSPPLSRKPEGSPCASARSDLRPPRRRCAARE